MHGCVRGELQIIFAHVISFKNQCYPHYVPHEERVHIVIVEHKFSHSFSVVMEKQAGSLLYCDNKT